MRKGIMLLLVGALSCLWSAAGASPRTPDGRERFDRGRELYALGRWADAAEEFAAVCRSVPQPAASLCEEADYYAAMCSMELKEERAGELLADFLRRHPASVHANDVEFALASLHCTAERYDEAQRAFAAVDYDRLSPAHRQQYDIRMGYIRFQQGDCDDALRYFRRIPSPGEYADHALYYISYIAYLRGDNAAAKAGFTELSRSQAYGAVAPFYLLQIEFNEGNYRYTVAQGGELIERATGQRRTELRRIVAEGWFHLGDYGRTEESLGAYRSEGGAMGRNENYLLGYSLYRQARYDEARPFLQQVCGADDALTQNASYHLADCYLRAGDKQRAMQSFAMAANEAFDPAIAEDALFNYGKLQYELGGGLFNEAIHVLNRYIAQYPASERAVEARELLIAAYYNSRNYEAAYAALKLYPSPDNNLKAAMQKIAYFRGLEAYSRGDLDEAARTLAESAATNVSPKYGALAQFWLGEIAFARGDCGEAERRYKEYLRRAPRSEAEYAMAHYNLGYCHFDRGDMSNAYGSFARFNQLYAAPDRYKADALNREADARFALRQFPAALETYAKAAALGTNEKYYAEFQRAVTLGILDRTAQKIEALERIIAADRGDYVDDATCELGRTYIASERYADGAKVLSRFVEEYPHSPFCTQALSDLGLAYLNLGQPDLSRRTYERVVEMAPASPAARDALQGIREIYVAGGDVEGYFAYAERVGAECDTSVVARDSLSFAAARRIYLSGDVAAAARSLKSYLRNYPKGYSTDDALFYLSDCQLRAHDTEAAIATLGELAARPANPYTAEALGTLSALTSEAGRHAEAAKAYRALYDVVQGAGERAAAATGYLRSVKAAGDDRATLAAAQEVEALPDAGATALREAKFARATILRRSGRQAEALPLYRELSGEAKTAEGAESAYRLIEAAMAANDTAEAEKLIFAFAEQGSPHAYWVAKAYIALGDLYVGRGDTFQARATYQSIVDGYSPSDDGIVAEAKARIAKLKK